MENSMTEYKKKNKLRDMIDNIKLSTKLFFAGKDSTKIESIIMDLPQSEREGALKKEADKLDSSNIVSIIKSVNVVERSRLLSEHANKFQGDEIFEILETLDEDERIKGLKKYIDKLSSYQIGNIIENSSAEKKSKLLKEYAERLNGYAIVNIIENYGVDEKGKLEELGRYSDKISDGSIGKIIMSLTSKGKAEAMKTHSNRLDNFDIRKIISSLDKEDKFEAIQDNIDKIEYGLQELIMDFSDKEKLQMIIAYNDKFSMYEMKMVLDTMESPYKLEAIRDYISKSQMKSEADVQHLIHSVVETMDDNDKMQSIKEFPDYIGACHEIIIGIESEKRMSFFLENQQNMGDYAKSRIISSFNEDERLALLNEYKDSMHGEALTDIICTFNDDKKEELMEQLEDDLSSYQVRAIIIKIQSQEKREELLDKYEKMFQSADIANIILSFDNDDRSDLIEKYFDKINSYDMTFLISRIANQDKREELFEKSFEVLDDNEKARLLNSFDNGKRKDLFEKHIGDLDGTTKEKIIKGFSEGDRKELVNRYFGEFDNTYIIEEVGSWSSEEEIKSFIEEHNLLQGVDIDLTAQYMAKLDSRVLEQEGLLNKETVELLGEQKHYQLFKNVVIPGDVDKLDMSQALEEPEKFKKYLELRHKYKKQGLEVQNIANGINEYSLNSELINNVLELESIDEKQLSMLESIVTEEPYEEIKTANDLEKYPELRKERIDERIDKNPNGCVYEILLGISEEEFKELAKTFSTDKSLGQELEGMIEELPSEEKGRISEIVAMLRIVELVKAMPEEQKIEALKAFNENLAKEFEGGSCIANIRKEMSSIKKDVRELYGKELSQSLGVEVDNDTVKEVLHDEGKEDIEVEHLKGEKFKMLVHGIDAYNFGNGHYEKREKGNTYVCTSLISDQFMGRARGNPYVGFEEFRPEMLIQEGSQDIFSYGEKQNTLKVKANHGTGFRNSDKLIEDTVKGNGKYNEINLFREYMDEKGEVVDLIPTCIVCFDNIDEQSKEEARLIAEKFGLDKPLKIRVIHTEKYKDRIEKYKKEALESKNGEKEEVIENAGNNDRNQPYSISQKVEEIMRISSERTSEHDLIEARLEIINTQELEQDNVLKKPTAMMSKDEGIEH